MDMHVTQATSSGDVDQACAVQTDHIWRTALRDLRGMPELLQCTDTQKL